MSVKNVGNIILKPKDKNGLIYDMDELKKSIPDWQNEFMKLKKKDLVDKIIELNIEIAELENKITNLSHRKTPKFTKEQAEEIRNSELSIRKKAKKYGCAKRVVEQIMKGTYNGKD